MHLFETIFSAVMFCIAPAVSVVCFIVSLILFIKAKHNTEKYSVKSIKGRKIFFIISSVVLGIYIAVILAFIAMLSIAIAYM